MSQHDMIIDNAVGATVRTDINAALAALVSNNSGATEPATMYADMLWMDTTANVLKQRNPSNTGWLALSGGFVEVTSAASPDIFGAAGVAINLNNSTPVTATSFAACLSRQVGTSRKVVPAQNWNVTASANLVVDGATSGTITIFANELAEVTAVTTTSFKLKRFPQYEEYSPAAASVSVPFAAVSSTYKAVRNGNIVTITLSPVTGTPSGSSSGFSYPQTLPVSMRPPATLFINTGRINNAAAWSAGMVNVTSAGAIIVYSDVTAGVNYSGGSSTGLSSPTSFSYSI